MIEIISVMDGVSPLFTPAIVALLSLPCWCMTQASNLWLACMHVLVDTVSSPSLLVFPLWLFFLLRLEVGICWPLGCNHKNWRMDLQSYWGC